MTFSTLLNKLIDIEIAASAQEFARVRSLTLEAEEMVLQLEREMIEALREKGRRDAGRFGYVSSTPPS